MGEGRSGGGGNAMKYSTAESESLRPASASIWAARQITPGVFSLGNTVMWILSIPFIMYECKCYKLAAVKTTVRPLRL